MTENDRHMDVVRGKLAQTELDHNVEIIFAVESGSRAWGFPSADSDWDARFVYRQRLPQYVRLLKQPDTLGRTTKGALYDVHGWDVAKALKLALASNATLLEWLRSPIQYRWSAEADQLKSMCERLASARNLTWNYFNLARTFAEECDRRRDGTVVSKKYLYGLRPALALRHLRMFPSVPPMNLLHLLESTDVDTRTSGIVLELVEQKASGREMGEIPRITEIDTLIRGEVEAAQESKPEKVQMVSDEKLLALAERLFLRIIGAEDKVL